MAAGAPATFKFDFTSFSTTEPAPTNAFSPMLIPSLIELPIPTKLPLFICTLPAIETPGAIKEFLSIN